MTDIAIGNSADPETETIISTGYGTSTQSTPASPAPSINLGAASPAPVMEFEKANVATSVVKTSGSAIVETYGEIVSIDDRVRVVTEYRVKSVGFEVQKDGSVARVQVIVPEGEPVIVAWDPSDPMDKGIIRARP